jgi:hypothetical protein
MSSDRNFFPLFAYQHRTGRVSVNWLLQTNYPSSTRATDSKPQLSQDQSGGLVPMSAKMAKLTLKWTPLSRQIMP